MKCRTCGYALWNLKGRLCPECAAPWKPGDYELVANAVRFCCPDCLQEYYGTGERGHLVPRSFPCVKCARALDMDEMIVLPAAGVREEDTGVGKMPWLERGPDAPWLGAKWFGTVLRALGSPARLMRATPAGSSPGSAVGFAFTTLLFTTLIGAGPAMIFMLFMGAGAGGAGVMGLMIGLGFGVLMGLVLPVILMLVWSLCTHGLLWVTGPASAGIGGTVKALGYSSGVSTIAAVPCLGAYLWPVAWVWWMISGTLMLREVHKVSSLRATFAVLTPPLILAGIMSMWFVLGVVPTIRQAMATVQAQSANVARTLHHIHAQEISGKLNQRRAIKGAWPRHVAELIARDRIMPQSFSTGGSPLAGQISIGGVALADLTFLSGEELERALGDVTASVPADLIAYRMGDYVFTYPGLSVTDTSGDYWVFIAEVPAAQAGFVGNPPVPAAGPVWLIGLNDGSVVEIADADLPGAISGQNALRRGAGLPDLPDPRGVTGWHQGAALPASPP